VYTTLYHHLEANLRSDRRPTPSYYPDYLAPTKQAFGGGYIESRTKDESRLLSAALFQVLLSFPSIFAKLSAALVCLEVYYTYGWIRDSRL